MRVGRDPTMAMQSRDRRRAVPCQFRMADVAHDDRAGVVGISKPLFRLFAVPVVRQAHGNRVR